MISLKYKNSAAVEALDIQEHEEPAHAYVGYLTDATHLEGYDGMETSINLPFDENVRKEISDIVAAKKSPMLKYIFVCGIGGSNLGPLAVYEAITSKYDLSNHVYPKLIFIDTVSPVLHKAVRELIDEHVSSTDEFLLSVVSKSGSTTETIANADAMHAFLSQKFGDIKDRVIVTTQKGSQLWSTSESKGFTCIDHRNVGGRFSVMSPVGQLPLRLACLDVDDLLKGARDMRSLCLNTRYQENPAMVSAIIQYIHHQRGVHMNDNFFFDPELESLGKWYRQLMAESLGKEKNTVGDIVYNGLTPLVSIGSTDLHSMVQLYLGGPRDKFTTFVYARQKNIHVHVSKNGPFSDALETVEGKHLADIMDAIYEGVKIAYKNEGLPHMEISMPEISMYTLGQYMQMKMMEIMYLGKLMDVNVFNQPSVEAYKKETRAILED